MKIGGSTDCKNQIKIELENLKKVGYDFAELDLGEPIKPNNLFEKELIDSRNILPIYVGHLPEINFSEESISENKKLIEIMSKTCGTSIFVMHLFSKYLPTEGNFDLKIHGLKKLTEFSKNNRCFLALENTEEDASLLGKVFSLIPDISFCLDVGHANLFAKQNRSLNLINTFKKRLIHIHMHDNKGGNEEKSDLHLPIGEGTVPFREIITEIKNINYLGNITLEIYNPDINIKRECLTKIKDYFV